MGGKKIEVEVVVVEEEESESVMMLTCLIATPGRLANGHQPL
jgi:hypothetical protein